jgi:hypothetical protein
MYIQPLFFMELDPIENLPPGTIGSRRRCRGREAPTTAALDLTTSVCLELVTAPLLPIDYRRRAVRRHLARWAHLVRHPMARQIALAVHDDRFFHVLRPVLDLDRFVYQLKTCALEVFERTASGEMDFDIRE